MEYDDVIAAFFEPKTMKRPPMVPSPARRFRDAIEPIAMHSVWSRTTCERLGTLGLDFFSSYVWGRASLLGEPAAGVVTSAFAVFSPAMLEPVYEAARATCGRDALIEARTAATADSLRDVLEGEDVAAVHTVADALQRALSTADGTGRPLFSGLAGLAWPTDPMAKLWRACELAREHRGDGHVAICVAAGFGPVEMNILTELWVGMPLGSYTATRGWSEADIAGSADLLRLAGWIEGDQLSAEGRSFRDQIEMATDALEEPILEALGDDVDDIIRQLNGWSKACIDAKAFPPDEFKRAAG